MCNLYRMTKGTQEVAKLFAVEADDRANFASEVYPGYPGLVVAEGRARAMAWGFPLVLKGRRGQPLKPKPVTNARDDKLATAFWRDSFARRRCLVPVSQWAEPRGPTGRMTRSWYALPDREVIAVAGLWRHTPEWGDCYTLVMADASPWMADVHDRMPVILDPEEWHCWTHGSPDEAMALVRTWPEPLLAEHTRDRWVDGKPMGDQGALF
ncbi:putative SOS response-associated peptidase YedK [Novosphingobium kunmingense]|uniref:Abasic site processing protein n=1 Tax=Novosphingobium kunmingense TaxID=1211806 RepID=A0A2N0I458_9SPHN|nr:SOS response-associated peptidase family protein [Novosphingobium kunmingense]PKB25945.1 putative SOS response-associated peptidase YedK [Novosphingobium kunmingense]